MSSSPPSSPNQGSTSRMFCHASRVVPLVLLVVLILQLRNSSEQVADIATKITAELPEFSSTSLSNLTIRTPQEYLTYSLQQATQLVSQQEKPANNTSTTTKGNEAMSNKKEQESGIITTPILLDINNNNQTKTKTIILGAGLGTTGTHLMYHTTCYMGYPSVHWNLGCVPHNDTTIIGQPPQQMAAAIRNKFKITDPLRMALYRMQNCVNKQQNQKCGSAQRWKDKMLSLITNLLENDNLLVEAFHDSPYPYFASQLIEAAHKAGKNPLVILSERNPEEYAARRVSKSHGGSDPICKDPTAPSGGLNLLDCISHAVAQRAKNNNNSNNNNSNMTTTTTTTTINVSMASHSGSSFSPSSSSSSSNDLDLTDVFSSFNILVKANETEGIARIAEATRWYQEDMKRQAVFTFDMFEKATGRTKISDLAAKISDEAPVLQKANGEPPAVYVNLWKGITLDSPPLV